MKYYRYRGLRGGVKDVIVKWYRNTLDFDWLPWTFK